MKPLSLKWVISNQVPHSCHIIGSSAMRNSEYGMHQQLSSQTWVYQELLQLLSLFKLEEDLKR